MELSDRIYDFGLESNLADLLVEVIARYSPEIDFQTAYISVRPSDRYIAAYFNKKYIDIIVDPMKVQAAASAFLGTRVLPKKTSTTAYLRVPADVCVPERVLELVESALAWREVGSRWSGDARAGLGADLAGETCQSCWTAFALNGTCNCD